MIYMIGFSHWYRAPIAASVLCFIESIYVLGRYVLCRRCTHLVIPEALVKTHRFPVSPVVSKPICASLVSMNLSVSPSVFKSFRLRFSIMIMIHFLQASAIESIVFFLLLTNRFSVKSGILLIVISSIFLIASVPFLHIGGTFILMRLIVFLLSFKDLFSLSDIGLLSCLIGACFADGCKTVFTALVSVEIIGRGREFLIAGRATFKGLIHLSTSLCFSLLRCEQAIARNCFSGATLAHTGYYTTKVPWLQGDIQIWQTQ